MSERSEGLPEAERSADKASGHWLLARLGKRVLRPGGVELSRWLVGAVGVSEAAVVELAPGLGRTARMVLKERPRSYVGVESDHRAIQRAGRVLGGRGEIKHADAGDTGLVAHSADIVVAEAMLTMQSQQHKHEIVTEARRILRSGGRYGIHELALVPDDVPGDVAEEIRLELARSIRVNARPLTVAEWQHLLDEAGFHVEQIRTAPMALLEPRRLIADEGLVGALRFVFNVAKDRQARRRVLAMRKVFRRHRRQLAAVAIIATTVER